MESHSQGVGGSTVIEAEVDKFSNLADKWWSYSGEMKMLHEMNWLRMDYISKKCILRDKAVLDIGCGGGILSIPMARLGAKVDGIDPSEHLIAVAENKRDQEKNLACNFIVTDTSEYAKNNSSRYDVIIASEVIEHVNSVEEFLQNCDALLKPNGKIIISTISRTVASFIQAKVFAEYISRWVPVGAHDWRKFISPAEIAAILPEYTLEDVTGVKFDVLRREFVFRKRGANVNYYMTLSKPSD